MVPTPATYKAVRCFLVVHRVALRTPAIKLAIVPILNPFPNITCQIVDPIGILSQLVITHRRGMLVSIILVFILPRKIAIYIAVVGKLSIYRFIPPRVAPTVTPSRRFLPLRLGRQLFLGPAAIGASVIPRYPYHRVIAPPARTLRQNQVGPETPSP